MSLISKFQHSSPKQKAIFALGVLSLFSWIYLSSLDRSRTVSTSPQNQISPTAGFIIPPNVTITPYPKRFFLRNTVLPPNHQVSFVYWSKAAPFYVSQNQIYGFFNPDSLHTFSSTSTPFYIPYSPFITRISRNQLEAFNPETRASLSPTMPPTSFFSPSLNQIAILSGTKIGIYQNSQLTRSFNLAFSPTSVSWSSTEAFLIAYSNQTSVVLSPITGRNDPLPLPSQPLQIEFSPSGKFFAVLFKDSLTIYSLSNLQPIQTFLLENSVTQAVFAWTPPDLLFLIEKRSQPRVVDYVYLLDPASPAKSFISESLGIPTRLNLNIHPVSPSLDNLMVVDNSGRVWIISTTPQDPNQGRGGAHEDE